MNESNHNDYDRGTFENLESFCEVNSSVHRNQDTSSSFDKKLDNTLDISQSINANDTISHLPNLYPDFNVSVIGGKFDDLPLQKSSFEKIRNKAITLHLTVEDKGESKHYLKNYRVYEISEINEKNEKKILCYRRYNNFDLFYNKLRKKYPYLLIPKLFGKKPLNKIITEDVEYYNKRCKQLNYFLNFIYDHSQLKNSRELQKFLADPECDEEFFLAEENLYDFPEASKCSNGLAQKFLGLFTYYLTSNEECVNESESEKKFKSMEIFYKDTLRDLKAVKNDISAYLLQLKKTGENYESLANNFFYMKDVSFETQNNKAQLVDFFKISGEMSRINILHYEDTGINIENRFEQFLYVLSGLCEIFERYDKFLKVYYLVERAIEDSETNTRSYDLYKLNQEQRRAKNLKAIFEDNMTSEVKEFTEKYGNFYHDIIDNFKLLIKSINSREISTLQTVALN